MLSALVERDQGQASGVAIAALTGMAGTGMAGTGKTALAVHWAHQIADRFPDGQLFVNLRGSDPSGTPVAPADAVRGFLTALGVPAALIPPGTDGRAALYRSLLADRRMLVVLDNAQEAEQVCPLLPGSPGCLVLVTSRNRLTGLAAADGAHLMILGVLAESESYDLMALSLGSARVVAEPVAVRELIALCGGLPLALRDVAARAVARPGLPLAALAAEIRDERRRLDVLETGESATSVRMVFSWSRAKLGDRASRMFRLLGAHPGPDITSSVAASLAGLSREQACLALAELWLRFLLGDIASAGQHLDEAIELAGQLGDRRLRALAGLSRACVLQAQDRVLEAILQARQALRLYQAIGDPRGEVRALYAIGWHLIQHDDHQQAITFSSRALMVCRESSVPQPPGRGRCHS
jgi:tetratricopeptide (TPR) repeat protein